MNDDLLPFFVVGAVLLVVAIGWACSQLVMLFQ